MLSLKRKTKIAQPKLLGLEIFDKLLLIYESLGSPVGLAKCSLDHPDISSAGFSTTKTQDNFTTLSLVLNVANLSHLPSLSLFLGSNWTGEVVLAATYYSEQEVLVVLQTGDSSLIAKQEIVYPHSSPSLIKTVLEVVTVGRKIKLSSDLATTNAIDPINELFNQLNQRNSSQLSIAEKRTKIALVQLRRIGAFAFFTTYTNTLGGNLDLILEAVSFSSYGDDYSRLDHIPLKDITPEKLNDGLDGFSKEVAQWYHLHNSLIDRIDRHLQLTIRHKSDPSSSDSLEIGYYYKTRQLFVRHDRQAKRFRPATSLPFKTEQIQFETEIAKNMPHLIKVILSLLTPKEAIRLEELLKHFSKSITTSEQLFKK